MKSMVRLRFAHGGAIVYFFLAAAPGQHTADSRPGGSVETLACLAIIVAV